MLLRWRCHRSQTSALELRTSLFDPFASNTSVAWNFRSMNLDPVTAFKSLRDEALTARAQDGEQGGRCMTGRACKKW